MENGYQWTVNRTTWNHLQTMWQAPPLDLLRLIYEETHHQTILEASEYRSPTWCILRALQTIFQANVVVGESTITASPFFEGAGRPSKSFWGPQQGRRVILWESLRPEDQEKCLTKLQSDRHWVIWCKAKPKDMAAQLFREYGKCIFVGKCTRQKQVGESQAESTSPCGKWLHMVGARASPKCELCKRERTMNRETTDVLPTETLVHIQSAGCKAQKKSVIGAHNRCWKYLIGSISTHGEATRDLEFIGGDKDKQLEKLWAETRLGDILPWDEIADEAERLLESRPLDGLQMTTRQTRSRRATKKLIGMKQTRTWKLSSDGEDRTLSQSSGATKFCTC
jgi:hypothetical protein